MLIDELPPIEKRQEEEESLGYTFEEFTNPLTVWEVWPPSALERAQDDKNLVLEGAAKDIIKYLINTPSFWYKEFVHESGSRGSPNYRPAHTRWGRGSIKETKIKHINSDVACTKESLIIELEELHQRQSKIEKEIKG